MYNNEQSPQYLNKTNDKQISSRQTRRPNHCDNLRIENEHTTNDDVRTMCTNVNKPNSNHSTNDNEIEQTHTVGATAATMTTRTLNDDDLDDDPYAELQSYLEKVKVSRDNFVLLFFSRPFFHINVQFIRHISVSFVLWVSSWSFNLILILFTCFVCR